MSRPTKFYIGATALYVVMYWAELKWWVLIIAPIMSFLVFFLLVLSPRMHQWIFKDIFFKIADADRPAPKPHKQKEQR